MLQFRFMMSSQAIQILSSGQRQRPPWTSVQLITGPHTEDGRRTEKGWNEDNREQTEDRQGTDRGQSMDRGQTEDRHRLSFTAELH